MMEVAQTLHLYVDGKPIPQGSMKSIGRGRMIHSNAGLKPWRKKIAAMAMAKIAEREEPWAQDLYYRVTVDFWLARPKKHYLLSGKKSKDWEPVPGKQPDLDKLCRAIGDALQGIVWANDSQIVGMNTGKMYAGVGVLPGCTLTIDALRWVE